MAGRIVFYIILAALRRNNLLHHSRSGSIRRIRSERLVAAAQKIGPKGDQRILNTLMMEITRRIMGMLRKCVGRQYRDKGWEIVHAAHAKLIEAVLMPKSADGTGLREAFAHRVRLRAVDAVRRVVSAVR